MQSPFVGDKKEKHSEQGNESSKEKAAFTEATFRTPFLLRLFGNQWKSDLADGRKGACREGGGLALYSLLPCRQRDRHGRKKRHGCYSAYRLREQSHGTAEGSLTAIEREGLLPRSRLYVHLSVDAHTAARVGARHGKPTVLVVDAAKMTTDGYDFYVSENGVWLTKAVPPRYLSRLDEK
jgi:hypothetical protein